MHDPARLIDTLASLAPEGQEQLLSTVDPSDLMLFDLEWEAASRREGAGHPEIRLGNGVLGCAGPCGLLRRGSRSIDLAHHPLFFATLRATRD